MKISPLVVLTKAHGLLSDKKKWCKGELAKNSNGKKVTPRSPLAIQWCALGAAMKFNGRQSISILEEAADRLYGLEVTEVNDNLGYGAIRQIYRYAIRLAEQRAAK